MKKHKFTWIDALIIAVVLLLVIGTYMKFFVKDTTSVTQETVEFQYQLKISGVRSFTADALQVGDTVYVTQGKGAVGTISDIFIEPAKYSYETDTGEVLQAEVEDRYDITLTISAEGVAVGDTYKIGTNTIYLNQNTSYFTKYVSSSATTVSIG